jgi:hypothetical protein
MIQPDLSRLKAQLAASGLAQQNATLFQVINSLIDALKQSQVAGTEVTNIISGSVGAVASLSYLTESDETADLINSRQLIAGAGMIFDISVPGQLTLISLAGVTWDILTDGDLVEPELVFVDGNAIMVHIP